MNYKKLREEPLKNAVQQDFFKAYKYTQLGNIDFVIAKHNTDKGMYSLFEAEGIDGSIKSILWAEAKQGSNHDIYESFVQLILTIGKERTFEKNLPPKYIGAFDAETFALIEYHNIQEVFYQNDFNWKVPPSNHNTKEFRQLYSLCEKILTEKAILFKFETQSDELKEFIKLNFKKDKDVSEKISVTKNNFTFVFQKWSDVVKPTINVDWDNANKIGIISADFFLADLLSSENESLKDCLYVVLKKSKYELAKKVDDLGFETSKAVGFKDRQKAYKDFWAIYARPPKEEYWDYIIGRRDLLVPQDIRERKGSYFTPRIWVEKSQDCIAEVLGETWQDEYYIWDNSAGTGNLLNGLTNYDNVWASTIDKQDVDVMLDRINNGWNMPEDHVFQFDFLNDDFSKCPEDLQVILQSEEKRKKLVIYMNPPYAEVSSIGEKGKAGVNQSKIHDKYQRYFGTAGREIYVPFLWRCFHELKNCIIAEFSKVKILQGSAFAEFRKYYTPELVKMFSVPAWTFDNVKGNFPIAFKIWDTKKNVPFAKIQSLVYDENGEAMTPKVYCVVEKNAVINKWITKYKQNEKKLATEEKIGFLCGTNGNDFQQNGIVYILNKKEQMANPRGIWICKENLIACSVYISVRHCVTSNWLNDRDQFLVPNEEWKNDREFLSDCLIHTLFDNNISVQNGVNYWIPYTREQTGCKKSFKSNFMSDFLSGKIEIENKMNLFVKSHKNTNKIYLSPEGKKVYETGLKLWKYYHSKTNSNPNASFYDIRMYFQGKSNGTMSSHSDDEKYTEMITELRRSLKALELKIEPKVYKYGFLK